MNTVINGKRYNTDTAKMICYKENGYNPRDFSYYCDTLYKKKTGEFFLHGEGGANSKYSISYGTNSWGGSEKIKPLTIDEAMKFADGILTIDEYESAFDVTVDE